MRERDDEKVTSRNKKSFWKAEVRRKGHGYEMNPTKRELERLKEERRYNLPENRKEEPKKREQRAPGEVNEKVTQCVAF